MSKQAKHPVQTTEKSLTLLEELKRLNGARISELVDAVDMTKSAIHNHLSTLYEHGYVVKDGEEYQVGLKFLELGGFRRKQTVLHGVGCYRTNELAEETEELANLAMQEHGKVVYLYHEKGEYDLDFDLYIGRRKYMHNTAAGKAILSQLPENWIEDIVAQHGLPRTTSNTTGNRRELREELQKIRERGVAFDDEESSEGVRSVAAPIHPKDTDVIGAISVSAPTSRLKGERFRSEIPELVLNKANVIELDIRYS